MALEPITRKEKIIAGENLEPITRLEKFLKEYGGSGGGGTDDVYTVKQITNGATGEKELQGDYAGALAAWQSGKKLKFVDAFNFDGQEVVLLESFSYSKKSSKFSFVCYGSYNFVTYELTESGITGGSGETYIESLYVTGSGSFFLKSPSSKFFRVSVSDTGELSTEEVT